MPQTGRYNICLLLMALAGWSCGQTIAVFNQKAYENATSLKAEAAAVIDMANTQYSDHEGEVSGLMTSVNAAYEYAKGLPDNALSTGQWDILRNPEGNLLGGFFRLWKEHGALLPADIEANKKNIMKGFDTIIDLDAAKLR